MAGPVSTLLMLMGLAVASAGAAAQELGDPGVIDVDGDLVQIEVRDHVVRLTLVRAREVRSTNIDMKVEQLTLQIDDFLEGIEDQEDRRLSDQESLHRSASYARNLIEKIHLLQNRLRHLDEFHPITKKVNAAAHRFDVPAIKDHLKEKLALEDGTLAEVAFQLGGFQELSGEYQEARANYQRASNLKPDNQLYMDAHGKNKF